MKEQQLIWKHNENTDCYDADFDGFEYFIQTNYWNGKRMYKLYIVTDSKQNHITGNKSYFKIRKLAEADLVRRQNER